MADTVTRLDYLGTDKQPLSGKGQANGYAGLDGSGHVPDGQLGTLRRLVAGGNLGATPSLAMQSSDKDVWLTGTLTANAVLTIASLVAGHSVRLLLAQDATGGRTLSVQVGASTVAVPVNAAASTVTIVECFYDGTDLYVGGGF